MALQVLGPCNIIGISLYIFYLFILIFLMGRKKPILYRQVRGDNFARNFYLTLFSTCSNNRLKGSSNDPETHVKKCVRK